MGSLSLRIFYCAVFTRPVVCWMVKGLPDERTGMNDVGTVAWHWAITVTGQEEHLLLGLS